MLASNARSSFHHILLPPDFSNRYTAIKFSCNSHPCNAYAISNRYKTRFSRPPRPVHSMPLAPGRLVRVPLFPPPGSCLLAPVPLPYYGATGAGTLACAPSRCVWRSANASAAGECTFAVATEPSREAVAWRLKK